jgi:DNA-binding CsgD family transcriptional regulator
MNELALKGNYSSQAAGSLSDGFVLLNSFFKPVFVNHVAARILSYPQRLETRDCVDFLADRIRSLFPPDETGLSSVSTTTFRSGRRTYEGRAYRVNAVARGDSQVSVAILLQRKQRALTSLVEISHRFNLTTREQQVLEHLTHGMTTKEIAVGLEISPNTVKNFVRMLMVKMGVSTRSGLVGKAFGTDD